MKLFELSFSFFPIPFCCLKCIAVEFYHCKYDVDPRQGILRVALVMECNEWAYSTVRSAVCTLVRNIHFVTS